MDQSKHINNLTVEYIKLFYGTILDDSWTKVNKLLLQFKILKKDT